MKKLGVAFLLIALFILTLLLVFHHIDVGSFTALASFWLVSSLLLIVGPETISEITIWKTSIKRDVKAAKEIRNEVEHIRDELRRITKFIIEDSYIVASCTSLAMGAEQAARERLEKNWEDLSKFAKPIKDDEDKWWAELQVLFPHRRKPE